MLPSLDVLYGLTENNFNWEDFNGRAQGKHRPGFAESNIKTVGLVENELKGLHE